MKSFWLIVLAWALVISSCKKDDDTVPQISIEEQNTQDDGSILFFLDTYYMDELGRVVAFDEDDPADDNETPLSDYAQMLPSGVWYAMNPNYNGFIGAAVTDVDTQKILMQYDLRYFSSGVEDEQYIVRNYGPVGNFNTTRTTGLPTWNIPFYRVDLDEDSTIDPSLYEMEGFQEAIPLFNSTEKNDDDPYVFQGVIIVPSRLNYARDNNYYGFYNNVAVVSFELYKVQNDE